MVRVKLLSYLGQEVGVAEAQVDAPSVGRMLAALSARFGKPFDRHAKRCKVIVNGENVAFLKAGATPLKDGDEVALLPPLAGG